MPHGDVHRGYLLEYREHPCCTTPKLPAFDPCIWCFGWLVVPGLFPAKPPQYACCSHYMCNVRKRPHQCYQNKSQVCSLLPMLTHSTSTPTHRDRLLCTAETPQGGILWCTGTLKSQDGAGKTVQIAVLCKQRLWLCSPCKLWHDVSLRRRDAICSARSSKAPVSPCADRWFSFQELYLLVINGILFFGGGRGIRILD